MQEFGRAEILCNVLVQHSQKRRSVRHLELFSKVEDSGDGVQGVQIGESEIGEAVTCAPV